MRWNLNLLSTRRGRRNQILSHAREARLETLRKRSDFTDRINAGESETALGFAGQAEFRPVATMTVGIFTNG
jgi:hypothetical protein